MKEESSLHGNDPDHMRSTEAPFQCCRQMISSQQLHTDSLYTRYMPVKLNEQWNRTKNQSAFYKSSRADSVDQVPGKLERCFVFHPAALPMETTWPIWPSTGHDVVVNSITISLRSIVNKQFTPNRGTGTCTWRVLFLEYEPNSLVENPTSSKIVFSTMWGIVQVKGTSHRRSTM